MYAAKVAAVITDFVSQTKWLFQSTYNFVILMSVALQSRPNLQQATDLAIKLTLSDVCTTDIHLQYCCDSVAVHLTGRHQCRTVHLSEYLVQMTLQCSLKMVYQVANLPKQDCGDIKRTQLLDFRSCNDNKQNLYSQMLQTLHTKIKNKYQGELTDSIILLCETAHHHHVGQSSGPTKCNIMGNDSTSSRKPEYTACNGFIYGPLNKSIQRPHYHIRQSFAGSCGTAIQIKAKEIPSFMVEGGTRFLHQSHLSEGHNHPWQHVF